MYNIIQLLKNNLSTIASIGPRFMDDVNTFPSLAILPNSTTRTLTHVGAGVIYNSQQITIRGYVHATQETALDEAEQLARAIETVVQAIPRNVLSSAKVTSVGTDEGLFSPYAIVDVVCQLDWIVE